MMQSFATLKFIMNVQLAGPARRAGASFIAAIVLVNALIMQSNAALAQGLNFIRDTEIENLLDEYARPIFQAAGLGNQPIKMRIIRQDGFNAFVVDGQNVFINSGTLIQSETPNQVIGVIAHETGHIAGGHLSRLRQRVAQDSTKALLLQVLAIGAIVGGGIAGGDARKAAVSGGQGALLGGQEVLQRSILQYVRQQESAADQAGVKFLDATKQSGRGMLTTFEEFAKQEYVSAQYQDPYVRSHPMAATRIAQLRFLVEGSPYYNAKDTPALQLRHNLMRAKLLAFLSNRNPRAVFNKYPETDKSLPARYARAIGRYFLTDINAALPEIDALIRENPNNPYFWELKGELLFTSGRVKEAAAPYRKALSMATGDTSIMRVNLAQTLLADESTTNFDETISLLNKALITEDDNPDAYQHLANAYYKRNGGVGPESYLATARARFYSGELPEAKRFAKLAQLKLVKGSPAWIKADDIINFNPPKP